MADAPKNLLPLKDRITVTIDGRPREILMSFGLLNECTLILSDLPRVSMLPMDAVMRGAVLACVLAIRNKDGIVTEPFNPFATQIATPDVVSIITWVAEHALSFFLTAIEQNMSAHRVHEKALSLMASGSGSKASR